MAVLVGALNGDVQRPSLDDKAAPRVFDVTSVKPSPRNAIGGGFEFTPKSLFAENLPVTMLIEYAFDVRPFQIANAPKWASEDRFDVRGVIDGTGSGSSRNHKEAMKRLLSDRFQLRTRRETRTVEVLALVPGQSTVDRPATGLKRFEGDCEAVSGGCFRRNVAGEMRAVGYEWNLIALQEALMRFGAAGSTIVVDRTGYSGKFDLLLRWSPDPGSAAPGAGEPPVPDGGPSLVTALREQLGLTLQREMAAIEFFVVDSVNRPTPD